MFITPLEYRILEISYKNKLSHLGSCLSCVHILDEIYGVREENDPVVLSCGHAGLALYVVLEKYFGLNAEKLLEKHGIHPNRSIEDKIYCSTGSLGLGLGIATGYALSDRKRKTWCLISDGEIAEGICYEAFSFYRRELFLNLKVIVNANGYGAYRSVKFIDEPIFFNKVFETRFTDHYINRFPFLKDLDAHYYIMNEKDWDWVRQQQILNDNGCE